MRVASIFLGAFLRLTGGPRDGRDLAQRLIYVIACIAQILHTCRVMYSTRFLFDRYADTPTTRIKMIRQDKRRDFESYWEWNSTRSGLLSPESRARSDVFLACRPTVYNHRYNTDRSVNISKALRYMMVESDTCEYMRAPFIIHQVAIVVVDGCSAVAMLGVSAGLEINGGVLARGRNAALLDLCVNADSETADLLDLLLDLGAGIILF